MMTLKEVKEKAKGRIGYCVSCDICDGRACKNTMPGPGAKGTGEVALKNYDAWQNIDLELDAIVEKAPIDTSFDFFGKKFSLPVFAGPISNIRDHYSKMYQEQTYNEILVNGCKDAGICAFTGDGVDDEFFDMTVKVIKSCGGVGVPTIKPWGVDKMKQKLSKAEESGAFAVSTDIDAIGLPFLQTEDNVVNSLSKDDLNKVITSTKLPFIVKGIMNVKSAKKAIEAGAKAIVVSNHGGRVLDETPATAQVLKEIADFAKGKCLVLVDGGIRSGSDVFKALALGADAVLIARPFVQVVFGDGEDGIAVYIESLKKELEDAMYMCGARKLSDISYDMIRVGKEGSNVK